MSKVELELEDVAAVAVHLIFSEFDALLKKNYESARHYQGLAQRLSYATGVPTCIAYMESAVRDHAHLYPPQAEGVGA